MPATGFLKFYLFCIHSNILSVFKFLARQSFLVNLIIAILLVFAVILIFFLSLGWITNHGSYLKVPAVGGMQVDKAVTLLENEGFDVVITDSAYSDSLPLNVVKKQLPLSGATVKVNRTVFLNVNPVQLPMVAMPKLEGLSYRFAIENLKKNNLKLGDTTERPDFMKGSVLDQLYHGKPINPGEKVRWGSEIDLIIGGGVQQIQIPVPTLVGLTVSDAKTLLQSQGIVLASIIGTGNIQDTASAFVYRQNPDTKDYEGNSNYIQPGQTMDIWIQVERPVIDSLMATPQQTMPPPVSPAKQP